MNSFSFFDLIPIELFPEIFKFVFDFKDLGRLQLVCKTFKSIFNQSIWKNAVLNWWINNNFNNKKLDLEWLQKESGKDWVYFAQIFSSESKEEGEKK